MRPPDSAEVAAAILPAAGRRPRRRQRARTRFADAAAASSDAVQSADDLLDVPIEMSLGREAVLDLGAVDGGRAASRRARAELDAQLIDVGEGLGRAWSPRRDWALARTRRSRSTRPCRPPSVALETANVSARSTGDPRLPRMPVQSDRGVRTIMGQDAVAGLHGVRREGGDAEGLLGSGGARGEGRATARRGASRSRRSRDRWRVAWCIDFDWAYIVNDRGGSGRG